MNAAAFVNSSWRLIPDAEIFGIVIGSERRDSSIVTSYGFADYCVGELLYSEG